MKPTKITNLLLVMLSVGIVSYFVIQQIIGSGLPSPATTLNIVLLLPGLAVILAVAALPMIRYRSGLKKFETNKGPRPKLVEPAFAVRILALAKAVSLTGSVFVGWLGAVLLHQIDNGAGVPMSALGVLGAIVMVVTGVLVEWLFRIPPDRDGEGA
jgi:hypothetical protein